MEPDICNRTGLFVFFNFMGMLILGCVIFQHGQIIKFFQKEKGSQQVESILMHVIRPYNSNIQIMTIKALVGQHNQNLLKMALLTLCH